MSDEQQTDVSIPSAIREIDGNPYMPDAKGKLVPLELIKPQDLDQDRMVRTVMGFAVDLSDQVTRFRAHTMDDLQRFVAELDEEYGVKKGGQKGNMTFLSHCGLMKVQLQVADIIEFGPQLQQAKALIDECLNEWSETARPEIRAIITRAFNTDKASQVNRAELFTLLNLDIEDGRWLDAMDAIRDAIRIIGSREYVRFYRRAKPTAKWDAVTIDLTKAGV